MTEENENLDGPDLAEGVALSEVAGGPILLGHVHGEPAGPVTPVPHRSIRERNDDRDQ